MNKLLALAILASLSACTSLRDVAQRHPYVTATLVTSLALSAHGALTHSRGDDRHFATPTVNCAEVSCK